MPQCATTAGSSRLQAKFLDLISKLLQTLPFNLAEGIIRAAAEPQVCAADTLYYSSVTARHASILTASLQLHPLYQAKDAIDCLTPCEALG